MRVIVWSGTPHEQLGLLLKVKPIRIISPAGDAYYDTICTILLDDGNFTTETAGWIRPVLSPSKGIV